MAHEAVSASKVMWVLRRRLAGQPLGCPVMFLRDRDVHTPGFRALTVPSGPETIEDICKEVKARTGIGLIDAYQKNTKPAVVKFLDQAPCAECSEAAIYYAYGSLWNQEYGSGWNVYFDGDGNSVPASMIASVDYIGI